MHQIGVVLYVQIKKSTQNIYCHEVYTQNNLPEMTLSIHVRTCKLCRLGYTHLLISKTSVIIMFQTYFLSEKVIFCLEPFLNLFKQAQNDMDQAP